MILLREYQVSANGHWLTIDAQANPALAGVYIKSIRVSCTGDFSEADSSANAFDTVIASTIDEYTGQVVDFTQNPTQVRLRLDVSTFTKPFYLLITAEDPQDSATTCAYKNPLHAVTFNKYPFYKAIACSAKQMKGCDVPQLFVEFLMHLKALEASIAIGDTESINSYFNWLVLHGESGFHCTEQPNNNNRVNQGCGCHH